MTLDTLDLIRDLLLAEEKKAGRARHKTFQLMCEAEDLEKDLAAYQKAHEKARNKHNRICAALREFQEVDWK